VASRSAATTTSFTWRSSSGIKAWLLRDKYIIDIQQIDIFPICQWNFPYATRQNQRRRWKWVTTDERDYVWNAE